MPTRTNARRPARFLSVAAGALWESAAVWAVPAGAQQPAAPPTAAEDTGG